MTCKKQWSIRKNDRISDIKKLWKCYTEDVPGKYKVRIEQEVGRLDEYGLCFQYLPPETYSDQLEGYWSWELGIGGPSDSFLFYTSGPDAPPYKIEYRFAWGFDSQIKKLRGKDFEFLSEVFEYLRGA